MKTKLITLLALAIAGCSGSGESTTQAMTSADSGDTGMTSGDPSTSGSPTTSNESTGTPDPTTGGEMTTGETESADESGTTEGPQPEMGIEGTWLSEGDNVAQLLVDTLDIVRIDAVFDELTFEVTSEDGSGTMGVQTGTYASTPCPGSDTMFSIVLEQTSPSAITVEGIYEIDTSVDPNVLTYEVIQTQPNVGFPAPTCDDGFAAGAFGQDNVQIFERQ